MKTDTYIALTEMGLSLKSSEPAIATDDDGWNHFAFQTKLLLNGETILSSPFRLGMGHAKLTNPPHSLTGDKERSMFESIKRHPCAKFVDQGLYLRVMLKVAQKQCLRPKLADVAHSHLMDGDAFFSGETFEEWCHDYGYDSDSRKAYDTWKSCDESGRLLQRSGLNIDKLREILEDY